MSPLIRKVDEEIERQSLLKHAFYQRWSHGELTTKELAGYSREYFQLVKAVPRMVASVGALASSAGDRRKIAANAREEKTHVQPWVRFAATLGVAPAELEAYAGRAKTVSSVSSLESLTASSFAEGAAAMYAFESQLPKISRSKIEGLQKFYGMSGGDATRYFELHEEADVRHAAVWREILERSADSESAIVGAASASLAAQNRLLDSVLEAYCQ